MAAVERLFLAGLASAALLTSQSVHIPASQTDRNHAGVFTVYLESAAKKVVGLQWEFSVPPAVTVDIANMVAAKEATSAGKTVTCATAGTRENSLRYKCLLVGSRQRLADGPIAVVTYGAGVDVHGAPIRISMENVIGVDADLRRVPIPDVSAVIRIR